MGRSCNTHEGSTKRSVGTNTSKVLRHFMSQVSVPHNWERGLIPPSAVTAALANRNRRCFCHLALRLWIRTPRRGVHIAPRSVHYGAERVVLLLPGAELPSWKFWPSQRTLSISMDPSFGSSIGRCPVWYHHPLCTWVFLGIFWLEVSN